MRLIKFLFIIVLIAFIQTSCRTTKDITMFQDLKGKRAMNNILSDPPVHRIKPYDNLYVSVLTLDSEVNQIFNPSMTGNNYSSGTSHMYGTPVGQYINGYRVTADGNVDLPILGKLKLAGMTLEEAEAHLIDKAEEYLQNPTVQVKLLNYRVSVMGEVNNPGFFYNYEGSISIIDAIGLANGITNYANLQQVIINRQEGNKTTTYNINLTNSNAYNSPVFYLQPNDLVYVTPTELIRRRENYNTYSMILSTVSTMLVIFSIFR